MNESVVVVLLSVMVTVIAFLSGFLWVVVGRLLGEVSGSTGLLKGVADKMERKIEELRREGVEPKKEELELVGVLRRKVRKGEEYRDGLERKVRWVFVAPIGCVSVLLLLLLVIGVSGLEGLSCGGWILVVVSWLVFGGGMMFLGYVAMKLLPTVNRQIALSKQREGSLT